MAALVRDSVITITDHIIGTIRQIKVKRYWLGETIRWAYNDIDEDEDADIRDAIADRDRIEQAERVTLAALDEELEKVVLEEKKVEIKEKMVLEEEKKLEINTAEDIDTDDDQVNDAEEYEAWKSRQIAAKLKMEKMVEEERKVEANTQEDVDTVDSGVNESDDTHDDEA